MDKIAKAVSDAIYPYWLQIIIAAFVMSTLSLMLHCSKDPVVQVTPNDVEGIRAEIQVLKAEIDDYRRIRKEDNVIFVEMQNEVNEHLYEIDERLSRKPQSEDADVHVAGPIDGQYVITMLYRDYTYQTIVTGKPDSPKNMKYLLRWQKQKMDERDAAISYN